MLPGLLSLTLFAPAADPRGGQLRRPRLCRLWRHLRRRVAVLAGFLSSARGRYGATGWAWPCAWSGASVDAVRPAPVSVTQAGWVARPSRAPDPPSRAAAPRTGGSLRSVALYVTFFLIQFLEHLRVGIAIARPVLFERASWRWRNCSLSSLARCGFFWVIEATLVATSLPHLFRLRFGTGRRPAWRPARRRRWRGEKRFHGVLL